MEYTRFYFLIIFFYWQPGLVDKTKVANVGSKFSLEIVFDGSESDVDLIIFVSGWTLLRFISKMTVDCIIVPFAMDMQMSKKPEDTPGKFCALCKAVRSSDFIIALQEISCVIRHYPCSRWFQDDGKCRIQNQVDTKWSGGGGGMNMNQVFISILQLII